MANGVGSSIVNFGAFPGSNEASVAVTGQASINSTSQVEAWIMGDDTTSDHTASDHKYAPLFIDVVSGAPTTGVGFTLYARCLDYMQGTFAIRWVWSD